MRFDREWSALRAYAAERGVRLIGDLPIYVAPGSADHLAHPELFQRGVVAGAPPDALSAAGQLWGNPVYDWAAVRRRRVPLVDRARAADGCAVRPVPHRPLPRLRRVLVRAAAGSGRRGLDAGGAGPGAELFRALERAARAAAADRRGPGRDHTGGRGSARRARASGDGGAPVHASAGAGAIRTGSRTTGGTSSSTRARTTRRPRSAGGSRSRRGAARWPGSTRTSRHWSLIRLALTSPAAISIVPAQDVLGLDSTARMNRPGTTDPRNWRWRLEPGQLTAGLAARLREETLAARRTS